MAAGPLGPLALFGPHAVAAALSSERVQPRELLVREGAASPRIQEAAAKARSRGVPVRTVPREQLERMAGGGVHQGVALTVREWPARGEGELWEALGRTPGKPFLLVLDHLQDVGNLGAVLRSAWLTGVTGVVLPKARSAPLGPAALRASAGTAIFLDIFLVANLTGVIRRLKEEGVWVYGLEAGGNSSLLEADMTVPVALVLGAEHEGVSRLVRENCDLLLTIPMAAAGGSFNASVAAGIAMFEVLRQRGGGARARA